jgi:hypothetical protein
MDFTELVPLPDKSLFNVGLTSPRNARLLELFGNPRDSYTGKCQAVTNASFAARLATRKVGPIKVTGLAVALDSLRKVFERVEVELPGLVSQVSTAGMLCCRRVKLPGGVLGANISNHSWGIAVDLKIAGALDDQGDGLAQRGLLILSSFFNSAGWYWGAGFSKEDSMHFETSTKLLSQWRNEGLI